ncbi:early nodulin-like protein 19 [Actinidia eriantha]|uniref:early nodulin-like protein 19 n=1 Tax=Actinidia eriantha TaxID=165200 RepID=UPI0025898B21|nr:early nodulin-like protein 19 [Actinidia eriantha]
MSSSANHRILAVCFLIAAAATTAAATDHIVGGNRGWNPGVNYTLWANNHTFFVNDLISFRYQKMQYNVFEVNRTGYDNCTIEGALGNWSSGKDFILLDKAQRYYFICGTGGCYSGMKVSVVVHPLPPPPSATVANEHSLKNSATPVSSAAVAKVVLAVVSAIWFGSGWI